MKFFITTLLFLSCATSYATNNERISLDCQSFGITKNESIEYGSRIFNGSGSFQENIRLNSRFEDRTIEKGLLFDSAILKATVNGLGMISLEISKNGISSVRSEASPTGVNVIKYNDEIITCRVGV